MKIFLLWNSWFFAYLGEHEIFSTQKCKKRKRGFFNFPKARNESNQTKKINVNALFDDVGYYQVLRRYPHTISISIWSLNSSSSSFIIIFGCVLLSCLQLLLTDFYFGHTNCSKGSGLRTKQRPPTEGPRQWPKDKTKIAVSSARFQSDTGCSL